MTAFKIGSIYRQRNGDVVRLMPYDYARYDHRAAEGCGSVVRMIDGAPLGPRALSTGGISAHMSGQFAGDLIPGECDEHGNPLEDKKEPETVTTVIEINPMAKWPFKQTPTLDKLEADPIFRASDSGRAPLPYFTERAPDPWAGYVVKSNTSEHHSAPFLCASTDLQDESAARHLLVTVRG